MPEVSVRTFHTGTVSVSPALPFGGEDCGVIRASGLFCRPSDRLWLPVSSYLVELEGVRILVDTGWSRDMSPNGVFDKKSQIASLGSRVLYMVNQGIVPPGECVDEQLAALGLTPSDLDYVLLTHLDCDHANGLKLVRDAKQILVSADEARFAAKHRARYRDVWWKDVPLSTFEWNGTQGPAGKSYDVIGGGSVQMINIPGHSDGLCAVKIKNSCGKFALLFSDGGYARKSWEEGIVSGIATDRAAQKKSLEWIREQSLDPNCVLSVANHDPDVVPGVVEF